MEYKMDMLHKAGTWELSDLPPGCRVVKSKWVYKLKADGQYCARLVAKGFTQIPGIDYDETFSPVACFESLRLLLVLAVLEDWHIHQMDVKSAFLNGVLDEEIYMEQPPGFITSGAELKVCQLKKSLYGLKQAPHQWNIAFHTALTELGLKWMACDAGIYVHPQRGGMGSLYLILYVDDVTFFGSSMEDIEALKTALSTHFEMTDMGEIQSYLGIRILRDRPNRRLEIDQSRYLRGVLARFNMADANLVLLWLEPPLANDFFNFLNKIGNIMKIFVEVDLLKSYQPL